jgi:hypothetical protein
MRKIIRRVQDLGKKAEQLKATAAALPARAAELRETVLMSGAQLQQLRADVQSSVAALRTDSDDRISRALGELNDNADTFRDAGYELDGVDLELGPAQRLIVHLDKLADVDPRRLRALLQSCGDKPTARAVLAACLKADETAGQIQLSNLDFCELIVHAGPVPTVRLCWRAPAEIVETGPPALPATAPASVSPPPLSSGGRFGEKSFFESRGPSRPAQPTLSAPPASVQPESGAANSTSSTVPNKTAPPPSSPATTPSPLAEPPPAAAAGAAPSPDWRQSALDRFKRMPDLSRPRST